MTIEVSPIQCGQVPLVHIPRDNVLTLKSYNGIMIINEAKRNLGAVLLFNRLGQSIVNLIVHLLVCHCLDKPLID